MQIMTDTSTEGMRRAIEEGHWQSWLALRGSSRVEIVESAELVRFTSGLPMPPFNSVMRARLDEGNADRAIEDAMAHFAARKLPWSWTLEQSATPTDLAERLIAHGLIEDTAEAGMAIDLRELEAPAAPEGLAIEEVRGSALAGEYAPVVSGGFGMPEEIARGFGEIISEVPESKDATVLGYLARLDGSAVATSMLIAGEVAGIYNVSTLADYRGRGIGAAVTVAPLLEAKKRGYRIGSLQSSAMGYRVYERLGFREYCRFRQFVWMPP